MTLNHETPFLDLAQLGPASHKPKAQMMKQRAKLLFSVLLDIGMLTMVMFTLFWAFGHEESFQIGHLAFVMAFFLALKINQVENDSEATHITLQKLIAALNKTLKKP